MNAKQRQKFLTLEMLAAIEVQSNVTQRDLAKRMNVVLGLANSYLTPTGFSEKSRLTAEYLSNSFGFHRKSGDSCDEVMRYCQMRNWTRMMLCGVSALAAIASLGALQHGIVIVGVYDRNHESERFLNKDVFVSLEHFAEFEVCLVTDLTASHATFDHRVEILDAERIVVPSILGLKND